MILIFSFKAALLAMFPIIYFLIFVKQTYFKVQLEITSWSEMKKQVDWRGRQRAFDSRCAEDDGKEEKFPLI